MMKFSLSNIIKSTILLEGRLENVVKKYADEMNQSDIEVIEYLSKEDPSGNNKYLDWMTKVYLGLTNEMELDYKILNTVKKFHQNISRIPNKDINSYATIKDLKIAVDEAIRKAYTKKAKKNVMKIFEDDDILVLAPLSIEASCKYGSGTKWCIASTNNEMVGNPHFADYTQHSNFYFLINKNMTPENNRRDYKYALQFKRNKDVGALTWWDAQDDPHEVKPSWVTDEVLKTIISKNPEVSKKLLQSSIKDFIEEPRISKYGEFREFLTDEQKKRVIDELIKKGLNTSFFGVLENDLSYHQMKVLLNSFTGLSPIKVRDFHKFKKYLDEKQLLSLLESNVPSLLEDSSVLNWIDENYPTEFKNNLMNKLGDQIKKLPKDLTNKLLFKKWEMSDEELEAVEETSYYVFLSSGDWDSGERKNFIDSLVKVDKLDPNSHRTLNMMKMRKQFQPATKMYGLKTTAGLLDDYVGMSDDQIDEPILKSIKEKAIELR